MDLYSAFRSEDTEARYDMRHFSKIGIYFPKKTTAHFLDVNK